MLDLEYLKRNFFRIDDGRYISDVMGNGRFLNGECFSDRRQRAIMQAQFGDRLSDVEDIRLTVKPATDYEFDVEMLWHWKDGRLCRSSVSGEDLYGLISQAVVLANVEDFNPKP